MANIDSLLGHQTHLLLSRDKPMIGNFLETWFNPCRNKIISEGGSKVPNDTGNPNYPFADMPIEQTSHIMTISVRQIFSEFETGDRKENDSLLGPFQL